MFTDDHSLVFITLVHYQQQALSRQSEDKQALLRILHETKARFQIRVAGYAILDDHLHWLFSSERALPAAVVTDLKARYARVYRERHPEIRSAPLWEGGFKIQDVETSEEIRGLLDLMHYDPVRHGYVSRPVDYEWTSLPARILQGHYPDNWGCSAPPPRLTTLPLLRGVMASEWAEVKAAGSASGAYSGASHTS